MRVCVCVCGCVYVFSQLRVKRDPVEMLMKNLSSLMPFHPVTFPFMFSFSTFFWRFVSNDESLLFCLIVEILLSTLH